VGSRRGGESVIGDVPMDILIFFRSLDRLRLKKREAKSFWQTTLTLIELTSYTKIYLKMAMKG
jgi:hypothetical protein